MSIRLQEVLPDLAHELTALLQDMAEPDLVRQIPQLLLVDRCCCGDDFCATFYTAPKPNGAYGPTHETISLNPSTGEMILDLVDRNIVCVEILFRDEIRKKIVKLFAETAGDIDLPDMGAYTQ